MRSKGCGGHLPPHQFCFIPPSPLENPDDGWTAPDVRKMKESGPRFREMSRPHQRKNFAALGLPGWETDRDGGHPRAPTKVNKFACCTRRLVTRTAGPSGRPHSYCEKNLHTTRAYCSGFDDEFVTATNNLLFLSWQEGATTPGFFHEWNLIRHTHSVCQQEEGLPMKRKIIFQQRLQNVTASSSVKTHRKQRERLHGGHKIYSFPTA